MADEGHGGRELRWEVVPRREGPYGASRHPVVLAGDAALGAAAGVARVGLRVAAFGVGVGRGGGPARGRDPGRARRARTPRATR